MELKTPHQQSAKEHHDPADIDAERHIAQQALVAEFGRFALRAHVLDPVLTEACRVAAEGLGTTLAKVLERLPAENALLLRAGIGWKPGLVGHARVGADLESPAGFAFKTGEPVISNHLSDEKRFRTPKLMADHGVKRAVNVIIQGDGDPYGVLEADSRDPGAFSPNDVNFLQALANTLGVAIDRQDSRAEVERLHAELATREAHLRRAVEMNPQVPWAADADGRMVDFSERWLTLTGMTRGEALGQGWVQAAHPDDRPTMAAAWTRSLATGEPYKVEHRIRIADGSYRWMRTHANPWRDEGGQIAMWYGGTEDIHERKLADQRLTQSEERLAVAVDAAALGIYDFDVASGGFHWDARVREMWGIGENELITYDLFTATIHPDDHAVTQAAVERALNPEGDGRYVAQYRITRCADGDVRWIAATGRAAFENGRAVRLVGTVQDVTERVAAEERLRRALADKDLLTREIDHRVKNSLTMVGSLLNMQERAVDSVEAKTALAESSARLMTIARIHEQLYRSADLGTVEFGSYLERLTGDVANSLGRGDADIRLDAEAAELPIDQAVPLGLIATELVTNALKYAKREAGRSTITITFSTNGDRGGLSLTVSDDGPGLPDGFDPSRSSGLGMRLVRSLARQLGGKLEATNVHGGARFVVHVSAAASR